MRSNTRFTNRRVLNVTYSMDTLSKIHKAWESLELPTNICDSTCDDGCSDVFLNRTFSSFSNEEIELNTSCLTFFSAAALRYYTASFLICANTSYKNQVAEAIDNLFSAPKIDVNRPSYKLIIQLFTKDQLNCIKETIDRNIQKGILESDCNSIQSFSKLNIT